MAEYQSLLDRIQTIVTSMGYHIGMTLTGATYVFTIYDNETRACYIQIGQSTGTIVIGKTRTKKEIEDHDTIDIAWLSTEPAYKGQGLALFREEVAKGMTEAAEKMREANLDTSLILFSMWTESIKEFAEKGQGNVIFLDGSTEGMQKSIQQMMAMNSMANSSKSK